MHPVRLFLAVALAAVTLSTSALAQGGAQGGAEGGASGGLISVGGAAVFLWGLYQYLN